MYDHKVDVPFLVAENERLREQDIEWQRRVGRAESALRLAREALHSGRPPSPEVLATVDSTLGIGREHES